MIAATVEGSPEQFETHQRMANTIVEVIKEKGSCEPRDLLNKGFTYEEIERCWSLAYGLAKVELDWMDS